MAIVQYTLISEGSSGEIDSKLTRRYQKQYKVVTDDVSDGQLTILSHPLTILPGALYAETSGLVDLGAWCRSVRVERSDDDGRFWTVTVDYSSELEALHDEKSPTLRIPKFKYSLVETEVDVVADINGIIVNSSAQLFNPLPKRRAGYLQIEIERNFLNYNALVAWDHSFTINSVDFLGFPPHTLLCTGITNPGHVYEDGILYYPITGTFVANPNTWDEYYYDRGTVELIGGEFFELHDESGAPVSEPVFLDGNGQRLPPGGTPVQLGPYFLYPERDFNLLGLV